MVGRGEGVRAVKPSAYHRMSLAEKERHTRERAREPAITCPVCEVQTTVDDLLAHLAERCEGRREPHHASRWVTWREALSMGILRGTLSRWVQRREVRVKFLDGQRAYLLRDLVRLVTTRTGQFPSGNR